MSSCKLVRTDVDGPRVYNAPYHEVLQKKLEDVGVAEDRLIDALSDMLLDFWNDVRWGRRGSAALVLDAMGRAVADLEAIVNEFHTERNAFYSDQIDEPNIDTEGGTHRRLLADAAENAVQSSFSHATIEPKTSRTIK